MNATLRFEIVSGINKGYLKKENYTNSLELVGEVWQRIAKEEFDKSNIYVSAVIKPSKTVYNEVWGCPKGGEETVVITGVANKEFINNVDEWKQCVIRLAKILKMELGQNTMTCEFMNTELYYLK
jgi:hypothetical protein